MNLRSSAAFLDKLDAPDIRMRVLDSRHSAGRRQLAPLTRFDREREFTSIATALGTDGRPQTPGVASAVADPDPIGAGFAGVVRSDPRRSGLGRRPMDMPIGHQRALGTTRLQGTLRRENARVPRRSRGLGLTWIAGLAKPGASTLSPRQRDAKPPAAA